MRPQLLIAIDYDDTYTADTEAWTRVIVELQRHGHRVICVSARAETEGNRRELSQSLPPGVDVLLSYDTPKRVFARSRGHDVDIWIDDMPEAVVQPIYRPGGHVFRGGVCACGQRSSDDPVRCSVYPQPDSEAPL